ncbi:3-methyladenine DNA glycosylase [Luteitalea pratensis]|uniref:Putative 3-methyladenine DNA glycosylase n=1 Tax=Luteitalea pratensis TaxID=1855912 RepID=A0A143PRR0_LUTPR|nr:DNA-3-methyladenine glycosylase [Luteitalea pratensis]AMY11282.1 3-methyladenine DNA glycosylase [Luteitalea pratensis]
MRLRPTRALAPAYFARPTLDVAHDLIGMVLVHDTDDGIAAGVIVEVEAYIGETDPACHAAPGPTRRNQPLYGSPGVAYVYFNYGVHWLVNAVTEPEGSPAAVLIRALEPAAGLDLMRARRSTRRADVEREWTGNDAELCRGPGNLTRALAITGAQNRAPLDGGPLRIEQPPGPAGRLPVAWSPRIGIRVGQDKPWRAYVPGHPSVSGRPR